MPHLPSGRLSVLDIINVRRNDRNRALTDGHLKMLRRIPDSEITDDYYVFKAVRLSNGMLILLDGHHRQQLLREEVHLPSDGFVTVIIYDTPHAFGTQSYREHVRRLRNSCTARGISESAADRNSTAKADLGYEFQSSLFQDNNWASALKVSTNRKETAAWESIQQWLPSLDGLDLPAPVSNRDRRFCSGVRAALIKSYKIDRYSLDDLARIWTNYASDNVTDPCAVRISQYVRTVPKVGNESVAREMMDYIIDEIFSEILG